MSMNHILIDFNKIISWSKMIKFALNEKDYRHRSFVAGVLCGLPFFPSGGGLLCTRALSGDFSRIVGGEFCYPVFS